MAIGQRPGRATFGVLIAACLLVLANEAVAHSFNVALAIPLSGPDASNGKAALDGFLLATTERDSHADEVSDGHLGGLDVYVYTADNQDPKLSELKTVLEDKKIDFIVPISGDETVLESIAALADADTIYVAPGRLPYPPETTDAAGWRSKQLVGFVAAFRRLHGYAPTTAALHGYNAARRIDAAVRPFDGVGDKPALAKHLQQSRTRFNW